MRNSLLSLRSNTIISCDNNDGNVSDTSTTSTHCTESFVTGSIKECNILFFVANHGADLVGTDTLRDTTRFACGNLGFVNVI